LLTRDSSAKYCCGVHSYSQKVTGSDGVGIGCSVISFSRSSKNCFHCRAAVGLCNSFRRPQSVMNQSVMNAAAQLIYGLRHSDYISDAIITLHWLRVQETVRFKMAGVVYKATHGTAPSCLSQLVRVADLPGRRSLRSARTNRLLVPSMKLSTVGGRAFPVAGPTIWNSLPDSVIPAPSLSTFRQRSTTFLFQASFLTLSLIPVKLFPTSSGSRSDFITRMTLKIHG